MSFTTYFAGVAGVMSLVMIAGWLWQIVKQRAEHVDVLWTLGMGGAAVAAAVLLDGDPARRLIFGALVGFWSVRLAFHLIRDRMMAPQEDGRYIDLRNAWGKKANAQFFIFFQLQAALVVFFATAYAAVAANEAPLGLFDYIAVAVAVLGLAGEAIADAQLARFRRDNPGSVCTVGLWRYSRHPNYFFEWLHWLSYPLFAVSGSFWWLALFAPLLMYYLIRFVTGVAPAEARMKARRGDAFLRYQATTSEFWPLPPRGVMS